MSEIWNDRVFWMLIIVYGFAIALVNGCDAWMRWREYRHNQTVKWLDGWRR
jgi:hypothetical protein